MKKTKKKQLNFKEMFKPKNPFHWWGLIFAVLGVTLGGAIGGGIAGGTGVYIINMSNEKKYSTLKKFIISFSLTIGGIIGYIILVTILSTFIS